MVDELNRFDIVLVKLNPTIGSEVHKTRPCIIVSPNEMNTLKTIIIAPMTSKGFNFIFRPTIKFENKNGLVLLDQIRAIDRGRVVKKIGFVDKIKSKEISKMLTDMFEY